VRETCPNGSVDSRELNKQVSGEMYGCANPDLSSVAQFGSSVVAHNTFL
jgi:hypothetical protein